MPDNFQQLPIESIKILNEDWLKKRNTMQKVRNLVDVTIEEFDTEVAFLLRDKFSSLLNSKNIDSATVKYLAEKLVLLNFILLPTISEREIKSIFEESLINAMRAGVDVLRAVQQRLDFYGDAEYGSELISLLSRTLSYNKELIGKDSLKFSGEDGSSIPTAANWLRCYNQFFDSNKARGVVEEALFLQNDLNVRNLDEKEKNILSKFIQLYDFLRFPNEFISKEPIETEKVLPSVGIKADDLATLLNSNKSSSKGLVANNSQSASEQTVSQEIRKTRELSSAEQEIYNAYQGDPKQRKAIANEETNLTKKFGSDIVKLRNEFYQAVQKKNVNLTIAIIRRIVTIGDLINFLKTDTKLNTFLAKTWEKRYGKALADEFISNPDQPKFVKLFLRYILEERLGMSVSDAARVGLNVGNVFVNSGKKSYNKVAYFDVKTRTFSWFD